MVSREYEGPKTPYQRIMESKDVDDKVKKTRKFMNFVHKILARYFYLI